MAYVLKRYRILIAAVKMVVYLGRVYPVWWECAYPIVRGAIALVLGVPQKSCERSHSILIQHVIFVYA